MLNSGPPLNFTPRPRSVRSAWPTERAGDPAVMRRLPFPPNAGRARPRVPPRCSTRQRDPGRPPGGGGSSASGRRCSNRPPNPLCALTVATPNTPGSPACRSLGTSKTPAPRMTGVAKRKARRAAAAWRSPTSKPPTMVTPEREKPGSRAMDWIRPTRSAAFQFTSSRRRLPRRRRRGSEQFPEPVLEGKADGRSRQGGQNDQPKQVPLGIGSRPSAPQALPSGSQQPSPGGKRGAGPWPSPDPASPRRAGRMRRADPPATPTSEAGAPRVPRWRPGRAPSRPAPRRRPHPAGKSTAKPSPATRKGGRGGLPYPNPRYFPI